MTWQESIDIAGVISSGLIAAGAGDDTYGTINVFSAGGALGVLNEGEIKNGGVIAVSGGGVANSAIISSGGRMNVSSGGTVAVINVSDGDLYIYSGATGNSIAASGKDVNIVLSRGGVANEVTVSDGKLTLKGTANFATIQGSGSADITGSAVSMTLMAGTANFRVGGKASNTVVYNGKMYIAHNGSANGAVASATTVFGGNVYVSNSGIASDTTVYGGVMSVYAGGVISDTTIVCGGSMVLENGAVTEGKLTIDFTGVNSYTPTAGLFNSMTYVTAGATVLVKISEWNTGATYRVANAADKTRDVIVTDGEATAILTSGKNITNPFSGVYYYWNGARLSAGAYDFSSAVAATATALTSGGGTAKLNGNDLAVKWTDATTAVAGNVYLAGETTNGAAAWVELDGYEGGAGTTLYGAQGDAFASGTVNINAKSGSLRNLAAGANAGGTVKAVNLTFAGAELDGTGYAGGFGNVTDKVNTTITTGTLTKDFYAGALANKLTTATSVGEVSMTVAGGTFDGNIYGASAVKTDSTKGNNTRHTVGDVTLTVTGGSTTKSAQACIFAGGYATGDATGTVYTVDSVTATISGGSWGEAAGGRGVFGGVFASGVEAQVLGNVNITISGDATMGNVYGGGWAQKTGAKSIVGDVNISIEGGTIANVFGGGSHSSSGGTTETGDVTITVSGGNITGDIYARGQLDGDITGAASVIFTGANDFDCGVFGYSYVGGAASDAALSFSTYTGEFSGNIGGFNGITLDGTTAMTLTAIADDVSNGAWEFDLTDRADTLAGTSLLTWSGASFENDTIKVTFADDTQAQGDWNIATVAEAFSGTTFDVKVGDSEIATGLAYNQQIASGDYAGWGFELESGVLKFKQLA